MAPQRVLWVHDIVDGFNTKHVGVASSAIHTGLPLPAKLGRLGCSSNNPLFGNMTAMCIAASASSRRSCRWLGSCPVLNVEDCPGTMQMPPPATNSSWHPPLIGVRICSRPFFQCLASLALCVLGVTRMCVCHVWTPATVWLPPAIVAHCDPATGRQFPMQSCLPWGSATRFP